MYHVFKCSIRYQNSCFYAEVEAWTFRALETALRLQGVVRFLLLAIGFITCPPYCLHTSVSHRLHQEVQVQQELEDASRNVALVYLQEVIQRLCNLSIHSNRTRERANAIAFIS